jgi:hypothetical protein
VIKKGKLIILTLFIVGISTIATSLLVIRVSAETQVENTYKSCDINGDESIDIKDISAVARNHNLNKYSSSWQVNYDVNSDNIIDLFDLTFISRNLNKEGNSNGNLQNNGYVVERDNWIYYKTQHSYTGKLCKVRPDGTDRTTISSDEASKLNITGNWLIYKNNLDNRLYKIKTDGTIRTKLNDLNVIDVRVLDNYIYFTEYTPFDAYHDRPQLFRMKLDGSDKKKITTEEIAEFIISDNWVYYKGYSDNKLYKIKLDGTSNTKISDDYAMYINKVGDWIYYSNSSNERSLYKIKADGSGKSRITGDTDIHNINVYDGFIYYSNGSDSYKLYKVKVDGSSRTKLSDYSSQYINISDGWIYFNTAQSGYEGMCRIPVSGTGVQVFGEDHAIKEVYNMHVTIEKDSEYNLPTEIHAVNNIGEISRIPIKWNSNNISTKNIGTFEYIGKSEKYGRTLSLKLEIINPIGDVQTKNQLAYPRKISEKDGWVYYINESDGNKLYKIKEDGTSKQKLTDEYAYQLNIIGDWIYFYSQNFIYKIRTDGSNKYVAMNISLDISGNWTYGIDDFTYRLKRTRIDGSNQSELDKDTVKTFRIFGGWIYFISGSDNKLYRMNKDGSNKIRIIDMTIDSFSINDGYIYFTKNNIISKMNMSSGEIQEVTKNAIGVSVYGDWIYYISSNFWTSGYLYKVKTDGSEAAEVNSFWTEDYMVTSNWIYYKKRYYDSNKNIKYNLYRKAISSDKVELIY